MLKIASPGVPDFYQGNDLCDFSLVDPDNRRPVDFDRRQANLRAISGSAERDRAALLHELLRKWRDGRIKMFITRETLRARRILLHLFETGRYIPLETIGRHANHLLAFARQSGRAQALVVVPRCLARVNPLPSAVLGRVSWDDTAVVLPNRAADRWRDFLSANVVVARNRAGQRALEVRDILKACPAAVLERIRG
ncbi:MAG: hypothetical protein U1D55_04305 [Phycisphaerae bacterium]